MIERLARRKHLLLFALTLFTFLLLVKALASREVGPAFVVLEFWGGVVRVGAGWRLWTLVRRWSEGE